MGANVNRVSGRQGWAVIFLLLGVFGLLAWPPSMLAARAQADATASNQTVLGPGLYVFQTRIRGSTCGDAEPDGYVLSFFAAIDGVPGSVTMTMELVNTAYFKTWALTVSGETISGSSRLGKAADAPEAQFVITKDGNRFKGTGHRSYNGTFQGKSQRCKVSYDALIKRLDM